MTLFKLQSVPVILLEDDYNKNILPLLLELTQNESMLKVFSFEQPLDYWQNVLKNRRNHCHDTFKPDDYDTYTSSKCCVIINSINQMVLSMGWRECLKYLKKLENDSNVSKLILILHKDCLPPTSKLQTNLHHIAKGVISYDSSNPYKVSVQIKKGGKLIKSEDMLSYDSKTSTLKLNPVTKEIRQTEEEPEKVNPGNLSTFKIEVEQTQKLEKYKLKLPYMSKINEGQSKVYYEPDAVDDWDDEDPDDDLDI